MPSNSEDERTKKQENKNRKSTTIDTTPAVTKEDKQQASADVKHVPKHTGVTSSRGTEGFLAGTKYAGFVDIPLDAEPANEPEPEEPDYEFIDEKETSHEGQHHRSYNGQADHARKYPPGFGKDAK